MAPTHLQSRDGEGVVSFDAGGRSSAVTMELWPALLALALLLNLAELVKRKGKGPLESLKWRTREAEAA